MEISVNKTWYAEDEEPDLSSGPSSLDACDISSRRTGRTLTDDYILDLLEKRDEEALRELEKKYYPYCFTIAFNILQNYEDACEIVNDSFLDIWNSIPPARPERFSAYLATVVRHNSINLYKKNRNSKNAAVTGALPLDAASDSVYTDDSIVNRLAISDTIDRFLDGLSEKQNMIFVARFYFSESIEEISRRFDLPSGTVKSIIHRLKKSLKAFLEKEGIFL